jgi:hypothetical protein
MHGLRCKHQQMCVVAISQLAVSSCTAARCANTTADATTGCCCCVDAPPVLWPPLTSPWRMVVAWWGLKMPGSR